MKIRIYYEDTDCGGVVYYANYLRYMERSRTELFRDYGIELQYYHEQGLVFTISRVHIAYHVPARYNDLIDVESHIREVRGASIDLHTDMRNDQGVLLAAGDVTMACVTHTGKPSRIPARIRRQLPSM
jgi:acyl-CoA thioester hydrolase